MVCNYNTLIIFNKKKNIKRNSSSSTLNINDSDMNKLITSISENINSISDAKSCCLLLEEFDTKYNNIISKAKHFYIDPLASGEYNLIPPTNSTYLNIVNTLNRIISENPNANCSLDSILNSVMAASNARYLYDTNFNHKKEILTLKKQLQDSIDGINNKNTITNLSGSVSTTFSVPFNPKILKYFEIYGFPKNGEGIDLLRLEEIINNFN